MPVLMLTARDAVEDRIRGLDAGADDFAYDGVSNVVDRYVLYLRRKIDRPFGVDQLETVRGVGYRLRDEPAEPAAVAAAATDRR